MESRVTELENENKSLHKKIDNFDKKFDILLHMMGIDPNQQEVNMDDSEDERDEERTEEESNHEAPSSERSSRKVDHNYTVNSATTSGNSSASSIQVVVEATPTEGAHSSVKADESSPTQPIVKSTQMLTQSSNILTTDTTSTVVQSTCLQNTSHDSISNNSANDSSFTPGPSKIPPTVTEIEISEDINPIVAMAKQRMQKYDKVDDKSKIGIDKDIAIVLNHALTHHMEHKQYKELTEKYQTPLNVEYLVAPKCNPEIWHMLYEPGGKMSATQNRDVALAEKQKKLVKGLIPLAQAIDLNKDTEVNKLLLDSFQILAQVQMDHNNERKQLIKPELGKAKHLAFRDSEVTNLLFGDNLESEFKKADTTIKLVEAIKTPEKSNKKTIATTTTTAHLVLKDSSLIKRFFKQGGGKHNKHNRIFRKVGDGGSLQRPNRGISTRNKQEGGGDTKGKR